MNPADDPRSELVSGLADLRQVPLSKMGVHGDGMLEQALLRIVPEASANRVPVAAFNSSI